jgi:predicted GNAT family N-acyltransferase
LRERYLFERFDEHHLKHREDFSCGKEPLDSYLKKRARQDMESGVCAVYVLFDRREDRIAGYYTLSNASVVMRDLPEKTTKKLPRYPVLPATLIGRLALDARYAGTGLGGELLDDALRTALAASQVTGSTFVIVDALDDDARDFYRRYGFVELQSEAERGRLFLPMVTVKRAAAPGSD